jgi:PAS domain S-box-containing protein
MNTESRTFTAGEWAWVQERLARLGAEKSSLQLAVHLMGRLSTVSGVSNMVEGMLRAVLEVIGGTHAVLFYWIDGAVHYTDVLGARGTLESVEDPLVAQVIAERRLVEAETGFEQTQLLMQPFTKARTWVFPLVVGEELVGVFKMEGMHVAPAELREALPIFFNHAALVLKNGIHGESRLRKTHDALEREVVVRKQAETDLRRALDGLEIQVTERTAELVEANRQLECELAERKRAEAEIRRLSTAIEQSPVSIVITDVRAAIEYVNPKFTAVSGYTLAEVKGKNPRLLKGDKTSPEEYRAMWQNITRGQAWRGEFHNRKKNGEFFWESVLISPIVDERGQVIHFLAVKEDITQRKAMEEQLRQAQKLESIGQLAGGVAHDFNNILASITLNLNLMQGSPSLDGECREAILELLRDADRATKLIQQLLMFSGRSVLEVQVLDLNEVLGHLVKMLMRLIGEHINLRLVGEDALPAVEADRGMVEQVVMNLALNARDAMPQGGTLVIRISTADRSGERAEGQSEAFQGPYVRISVQDSGCGMTPATLKRIFEPFFTTKSRGRGTGLGLATVHGIVAQHKGWIEVQSEVDVGTTFDVYLPASARPLPARATALDRRPARGQETILLVEDEAAVRRSLLKGLRSMGYTVLEASNGREALKLWGEAQQRIDLLLTDMIMPGGLSGLDVANRLRRDQPELRVIIASGYNAELIQLASTGAKAVSYLQKPFTLDVLACTLRKCLDPASSPAVLPTAPRSSPG